MTGEGPANALILTSISGDHLVKGLEADRFSKAILSELRDQDELTQSTADPSIEYLIFQTSRIIYEE